MVRKLIIAAMFTVAALVLALTLNKPGNVANRDFIAYWSAGKLMAASQNPYDRAAVLALELPEGIAGHRVSGVRNPPWALWLMLPLGFLSASYAWLLWMAICVAALLLSIRGCWHLYGGGDPGAKSLCLLWGIAFAPVLACLMAGQASLLALAALVLFLRWEKTFPFWAGAALIVPLAKPQLFAPFFLVFAIWAILSKRWSVIAGLVTAFCAAATLALAFDPNIFHHYEIAIAGDHISGDFIPSLSGVMRALLFPRLMWVQFVPVTVGLIWAMWYYPRVERWDWQTNGLAVLLACILVAPYAFLNDEVVLLPVLLYAGLRINERRNWDMKARLLLWVLTTLSGLLLLMVIWALPLGSGLYFWSGLVWAGWYWFGQKSPRPVTTMPSPEAAGGIWPEHTKNSGLNAFPV
jgi:hypothetical protein